MSMRESLDTAAAKSQRTRPSSTHWAVINTLERNVLPIENPYFVVDDAIDIVPDDSKRTQQVLAGAHGPGARCGAEMPAPIRRFKAKCSQLSSMTSGC
jgi:hypothetical protein